MQLCPYCSFSNPETATHCLGCGNDLPLEDAALSHQHDARSSFGQDDRDVLGDMDAALNTLLREDLGLQAHETAEQEGPETIHPSLHDEDDEFDAPTKMVKTPAAPPSGGDGKAPHRPKGEFTAISPVDPNEWSAIIEQARSMQDSGIAQAPPSLDEVGDTSSQPTTSSLSSVPPANVDPPSVRSVESFPPRLPPKSPRISEEGAKRASRSRTGGFSRTLRRPEPTQRFQRKALEETLKKEKAASPNKNEPPPPPPLPEDDLPATVHGRKLHRPEPTDRLEPERWADIALARLSEKKPQLPRQKRETTAVEEIEELGFESIIDEDEHTINNGARLARLRDKMFKGEQPHKPPSTEKVNTPGIESAPTYESNDHTLDRAQAMAAGGTSDELHQWSSDGERTPEELEQVTGSSAELDHPATQSNEHTLGASYHSAASDEEEGDAASTGRWFGLPSAAQGGETGSPAIDENASTLHGAAPPILPRKTPAGPQEHEPTPKSLEPPILPADVKDGEMTIPPQMVRESSSGPLTFLVIAFDVESSQSEKTLGRSKRLLALEGLPAHLSGVLREHSVFLEEIDEALLVASLQGAKDSVNKAIFAASLVIDEVNRHNTPIPARIRVRCVIATVTDEIELPRERALSTAGKLLRGMPVDRIWLDWTTYCSVEQHLHCQEVALPSLAEPAYEVEGLDGAEHREAQETGKFAGLQAEVPELPWVGRQRELDALMRHWSSVQAGEGRAVLLHGAPGSGRSRLIKHFIQQVSHEAFSFLGSSHSCPIETNTSPYLAGLLQNHLHTHQINRQMGLRQQIASLSVMQGHSNDHLEQTSQLLFELTAEGPSEEEGRTEETFAWYMQALTTQRPVLVVFDDLYLLERRSKRLLELLYQSPLSRVMLVIVSSPGEFEEILFSSLPQAHRLELPAMSEQESRELLNAFSLPNALTRKQVERMISEAEGNPKLLVTLAEASRKSQERGMTWSHDLALPDAVERMMMQRQKGLSHLEKDTLRKAAVIGDRFWKGAVECLERLELSDGTWGLREGVVISHVDDRGPCLQQLVEGELIEQVPHSNLPHEQEFRFPHRLLRRSLTRQIPISIRQKMHRQVAQWLSLRDDAHTMAFEIARHLKLAGDPEGAAWRLYEASQECMREDRITQVLALLAEAIDLLGERNPVLRLKLLVDSADAYAHVGDVKAAIQQYESALQLSWRLTSPRWGARIFVSLSRCLTLRGEFQRAQGFLLDAKALALQSRSADIPYLADIEAARIFLLKGELDEAQQQISDLRAALSRLRDEKSAIWAEMLSVEGWFYRLKGQWRDAIKSFQEATSIRRQLGETTAYAESLMEQAEFYLTAGDEDTAAPLLEEAVDCLRQKEALLILQKGLLLSATIALARRDTQKALSHLEEAWKHCQMAGESGVVAQTAAALAAAYVLLRQPHESLHFAKIAIQRLKEGPAGTRATIYFFLGEAAASMTPEQIEQMFNPMPQRLPEGGMPTFLFLKSVELYKRAKESARQISTLLSLGRSLLIGGFTQTAINVLDRGINDANTHGLGMLLDRLRNQRRLLSQDELASEDPDRLDSSHSTLVVRKNRQPQKNKPFASETGIKQPPPQAGFSPKQKSRSSFFAGEQPQEGRGNPFHAAPRGQEPRAKPSTTPNPFSQPPPPKKRR